MPVIMQFSKSPGFEKPGRQMAARAGAAIFARSLTQSRTRGMAAGGAGWRIFPLDARAPLA